MRQALRNFLQSEKGRLLIRWSAYTGLAFLSVWLITWFLRPYYAIGINETDSLSGHVYLIMKQQKPERGDLIVFRAPNTVKYYPPGHIFTKIAVGMPGDVVEFRGREVFINGKSFGYAKTHSQKGHPLNLGPTGVIPAGHYFAWTHSKHSYDSRYADIGWVTPDRLEGKAIELF